MSGPAPAPTDHPDPARAGGLRRHLSLLDAAMVVVGAIVGSGIFINPYLVAATVGDGGVVLGLWAFGGLVALVGALVYADLGALRPRAGGQYVYLAEALHPLVGFLYGWALLLVILTGAMAAVGITFARYATELVGWQASDEAQRVVALVAIALLTAVNYVGLRPGVRVQNLFTFARIAVLLVLVAVTLLLAGAPAAGPSPAPAHAPHPPLSAALLGAGLVPILFAYGGWQQLNYLGGEVREPRRNLPLALLLGTGGVVVIYLAVNAGYLRVLGAAGLAESRAPASDAARVAAGAWGARFVALGIASSTFGFLNLAILSASRVYYAIAVDGLFFRRAARLHPRFGVPGFAIVLQSTWAAVLLFDLPRHALNLGAIVAGSAWRAPAGSYGRLLSYVVVADWLFFGATAASLFVYRARGQRSDFRAGGYPVLPALFLLVSAAMVTSTVAHQPYDAVRGLLLIATGIPVFYYWRRRRRSSPR